MDGKASPLLVWLRFVRIENVLLIAILLFVIREVVLAPLYDLAGMSLRLSLLDYALLVLDLSIVAVTGYWINDRADRAIDQINRPHRLLASEGISGTTFWVLYASATMLGAIITIYLGWKYQELGWCWLYPVSVFAFWLYAQTLKKQGLIGNFLVSFFIAAVVLMALIAEPGIFSILHFVEAVDLLGAVLFFALIAFFANLARELIKDCEDVPGDRVHGVRSLPIIIGSQRAMLVVRLVLFFLLVLEGMMYLRFSSRLNQWPSYVSFGLVAVMLAVILWKSMQVKDSSDFRLLSHSMKLLMLLGLVQLIVLAQDLLAG